MNIIDLSFYLVDVLNNDFIEGSLENQLVDGLPSFKESNMEY